MNKLILYVALATLTYTITPIDYQALQLIKESYKKGRSANCYVGFARDVDGKRYVVKQYKHGAYSRIAATPISELVALEMGHAVGVRQNRATIVPAGIPFIGKDLQMPASVHEHVPGVRFDGYKGQMYKGVSICQQTSIGLTREIIYQMSRHKDLPPMVALDTFVGNIDRGSYNFFYDERSDSFMGIDMGAAFTTDLCSTSLGNLKALEGDATILFSEAEQEGLKLYYHTLKQLVALYPPEHIYNQVDEYAQITGLFNEALFSKNVQKKWIKYLSRCKGVVQQSYKHAIELVVQLEQLLFIEHVDIQQIDQVVESRFDQELDPTALAGTLQLYKKSNCINSEVVYFQDPHKNKYVVKQYKNRGLSILLATTLSELVALEIGLEAGVRVDRACLIPAGIPFEGKSLNLPAAIHTHAPGVRFDKYKDSQFEGISICQQDNQGLTRGIIYHMSRHKDLPAIVALDTFVGNNDRNSRNYFYDKETDSFMGIDMGAAFRRDFCKISAENIVRIMADETSCLTEREWEGLFIYKETLKRLAVLYPPDRICDQLDAYAQSTGLFNPIFFNKKEQSRWFKYLSICKKTIHKSFEHACALIEVLERLFE